MRSEKYHLYLNESEKQFVIKLLLELRNNLLENGKYTDGADDVILKLFKAKRKKIRIK